MSMNTYSLHNTNNKLLPFTLVIDHTIYDGKITVLNLFSIFNTAAAAMDAVKAVCIDYFSADTPLKLVSVHWYSDIIDGGVIDKIPSSLWAAHGLYKSADETFFSKMPEDCLCNFRDEYDEVPAPDIVPDAKPATRFTFVINCLSVGGDVFVMNFLSAHKTSEEAENAVRGAICAYLDTREYDEGEDAWVDVILPSPGCVGNAVIDMVPDDIWAAYGLARDTETLMETVSATDDIYSDEVNKVNMTRFTIAVNHDDDGDTSVLDLLSSHQTEEDAMEALKCAIQDYLNAHPEKGNTKKITWDEILMLFNEVPDSCLTAYGLARDNTPGFPLTNVYWGDNPFDGWDDV